VRLLPAAFATRPAAHAAGARAAAAVIDDDTPTPAHARFRPSHLVAVVAAAVALWAAALLLLVAIEGGAGGTLVAMAAFFSKAALLTFGGAYAVLPYVFQGAVETYGWLTPAQMIDGLALGETTPGPLIMVVAFVGYVGATVHALGGAAPRAVAGVAGALVATFFTFLPSFVFILAGGPLVESTHGRRAFVAPLTGITAAVVGVIASLAAFFAGHVLWPAHPLLAGPGGLDLVPLAIGAAAAFALFRARVGVIPVIVAAAAAGVIAWAALGARA
jgi:chromate transporter